MFSSNTSQVSNDVNYIEDVFSTYLYTGNGSTQTITNGIDLAGKGGLVWIKSRNNSTFANSPNVLTDSVTGFSNYLISSQTTQQQSWATDAPVPSSTGFSLPPNGSVPYTNYLTGSTYASWTFRKQPKFFDVVTYTGTGFTEPNISHNLGSVPGCIIIKRTNSTGDWFVYHRSIGTSGMLVLNSTAASASNNMIGATPTSTTFKPAGDADISGATYVAYLFAHNAGGFGLTGTDNVISCGSYNGTGSSTVSVSLGYEPQWVLIKKVSGSTFTDGSASWCIFDNMRGIPTGGSDACLYANLSGAENSEGTGNFINVTATGFEVPPTGNLTNQSACSYIYIAIRRGPMKTPTSGTSVFNALTYTGNATQGTLRTAGFPVDLVLSDSRTQGTNTVSYDRLRGSARRLATPQTDAEVSESGSTIGVYGFDSNVGYLAGQDQGAGSINFSGWTYVNWLFRRAPGFFDEVCYTGGGSTTYIYDHNLGVVPELIIIKSRSNGTNVNYWPVKIKSVLGQQALALNSTNPDPISSTYWASANDTATQFRTRASATAYDSNATGYTYVAYLFASAPGVSKVGSYTGTGTTQQINCGFTSGARLVLIKRTDSTGDWYVWDSARGIVAGNDPYLLLNSTAAEVTNTDFIDTASTGFEISSTAPAAINASGGTFIYLAIA